MSATKTAYRHGTRLIIEDVPGKGPRCGHRRPAPDPGGNRAQRRAAKALGIIGALAEHRHSDEAGIR